MATIFSKIIEGEIPSVNIYEDEVCVVILDISPVNKGHALVIARDEYETLLDCPDETLNHMMQVSKRVVQKLTEVLNIDGYNILINNKPASGQEVPHLHIHIIPRFTNDGKSPIAQKETYGEMEMVELGKKLQL